jgi:hypothetical protein
LSIANLEVALKLHCLVTQGFQHALKQVLLLHPMLICPTLLAVNTPKILSWTYFKKSIEVKEIFLSLIFIFVCLFLPGLVDHLWEGEIRQVQKRSSYFLLMFLQIFPVFFSLQSDE